MLLLVSPAFAASLDILEVGGPWGTPGATDATAVWWNPAGLAAGEGTRIEVEGAPTFATVTFQRDDPNGGNDIYTFSGVVPYVGVASDLTVPGLGVGVALAVPFARGGAEVEEPGPGAYHMREGDSKAIFGLAGAGYEIADRVAFGASFAVVRSSWIARVDTDSMADLDHAIEEAGDTSPYGDDMLEDPAYAATLQFSELSDVAFTFGAGARVKVIDEVEVAVGFVRGVPVVNTGEVTIAFSCPPDDDEIGAYATRRAGLCTEGDNLVHAAASVGYVLPSRVHGGVVIRPVPALRLEVMGGWVGWSAYTDFDIRVTDSDLEDPEGREMVEQSRLWARENVDSGWAGLDAKGSLGERWTVGGRLVYDGAAVPDAALSTNNYDANAILLSGLVAVKPVRKLELGVSWTHQFLADRVVTESAFGQTVEGERNEDRWNYPHMNGTYGGRIDRIGVQVRAAL
ncbi:MAG: OmpP1/FadL family transporter [Myxococcota bacterium]